MNLQGTLFVSLIALGLALPQEQVPHQPREQVPHQPRVDCADMPQFMQDANRIVGGEAAPSMIPWQVAMLSNGWQFCGGTILDACTILSARHCFTSTSTSGKTIRAGSTNKYSGGQTRGFPKLFGTLPIPTTA